MNPIFQYLVFTLIISFFVFADSIKAAPGDLDLTFSNDGFTYDLLGAGNVDEAYATAIQPDGKIVAVGESTIGSLRGCSVVRYNVDGSLDNSFDGDGRAFAFLNRGFSCHDVAIQTDGKIVAVGESGFFGLVRFNSDGSLDTSFGDGGKVTTQIIYGDHSANAVVIQTDGKIVIAGRCGHSYSDVLPDFALVRYNPDGSTDNSFGHLGRVVTRVSNFDDVANAVAIQSDGKIVAAGFSSNARAQDGPHSDFALVRYNTNGSLDTSFDGDGIVTTKVLDLHDSANAIVIQPDHKIVAAGSSWNGKRNDFALVRYQGNGSLDHTFDRDGKVVISILNSDNLANDVAIQTDGNIVLAGQTRYDSSYNRFALVRYHPNGFLDDSFGVGGIVTTRVSSTTDIARAVSIQTDGKIIAAGKSNYDFALVRYGTDGAIDTSFDSDGKAITNIGAQTSWALAVAIQADGKIVAAADIYTGLGRDFSLVRYDANGSLDNSFGNGGVVTTPILSDDDRVTSVAVQADGKVVAAGYSRIGGCSEFALVRYKTDGSLDSSFDGDGKVTTQALSDSSVANAVAIQTDGKIVAVGASFASSSYDFAVVRYNTDGSLDSSFGIGGMVATQISTGFDNATAVAIQSDGKIVVAGYSSSGLYNDFALARYNTDGSLDTTFDGDGTVTTPVLNTSDQAYAVAIQSDSKIIAVGAAGNGFSSDDFALVRYNTDGSLDTSFDGDGKVTTHFFGADHARGVAVQTDGKIVVAGNSNGNNLGDNFTLTRYSPDGSLDSLYGTNGKVTFNFFQSSSSIRGMALDSYGRAVVAGWLGGNIAVARFLGDVNATVEGRVETADGHGIGNVLLSLTDSNGNTQTAVTSSFGYFRFDNVPLGNAVVSVTARKYVFANPTRQIKVNGNISDLMFTAIE
ncbi:MAG: carboxypeptidase regulatory-like domain-containing protein [Pyrinomonadaceae bacterium]